VACGAFGGAKAAIWVAVAWRGCYAPEMQSLRFDVQFSGAIGGESNAVRSAEYLAATGAVLRTG